MLAGSRGARPCGDSSSAVLPSSLAVEVRDSVEVQALVWLLGLRRVLGGARDPFALRGSGTFLSVWPLSISSTYFRKSRSSRKP